MGIEMELLLVPKSTCAEILSMKWKDVVEGMEKSTLRNMRPEADKLLHRSFDVDGEAEILDWADSHNLDSEKETLLSIQDAFDNNRISMEDASEGVLLLLRWVGIGYWEAWEGRTFLYFEVLLDQPAESIQQLYEEDTWDQIRTKLGKLTANEYTEKVILDWMNRRKELGESLDEKTDPRILSTMQAHTRLTQILHHLIQRWNNEDDLVGILGREHLSADKWGHGAWRISNIVNSGLP